MNQLKNYKIRNRKEIEPQERLCGKIWPLSDEADFKEGNMSYFETGKATEAHYHKKITEMYFILSGEGKIKLDDKEEKVEKGTFVIIYPETVHKILPAENSNLKIIVASIPAWREDDEILVDEREKRT